MTQHLSTGAKHLLAIMSINDMEFRDVLLAMWDIAESKAEESLHFSDPLDAGKWHQIAALLDMADNTLLR